MRWIKQTLPISIVVSVFLHLGFMGALHFKDDSTKDKKKSYVEFDFKVAEPKGEQLVQQDQRKNNKTPTKESFLGKFDQSFEEQMRAAKSGKTKDNPPGGKFLPRKQVKAQVQKRAKEGRKKTDWKKLSLSDLKPSFDFSPEDKVENQAAFVGEESQSSDYLDTITKGNQNLLSTREFRFYTYFNRIRTQLQQYWEPSIQTRLYKLLRSGRSVASAGPRTTKILITLDNQGVLVGVQVLEDSGVRDLDEAAIEAFREAAPLPNPPAGIMEKDGTVKIRWDFVLEA